jgi:ATP-binding cassette subfamily B protein
VSPTDPATPDPHGSASSPADAGEAEPRGFSWLADLASRLAPLLAPHRGTFLLIGVLIAVELGLQLGQRKAFGILIDEAILKTDVPLLVLILAGLAMAAVVSGAAGLAHEFLHARLCARIPAQVRSTLYDQMQQLPLSRVRTTTHGDLVARVTSDAGSVEPALWSLGYIATALCGALISAAMLLWTDWRLALLGLGLMPLALIGPRFLTPRAAAASYAARTATGRLAAYLHENLANQVVLRVFGMGTTARARFDAHNARITEASTRYNVYSYFSHRVPWIAIELVELAIVAAGSVLVIRGEMTPGGLVGFYLLFSGLASHTYSLTTSLPRLIDASAGLRRIAELTAQPTEPAEPPATSRVSPVDAGAGLAFDAVSFRHDGETRDALSAASLSIPAGAVTAFVGGSGSGKSTALALALGLQRPRAGRVLLGGEDLATVSRQAYWQQTSVVFQDSLLFHATIAENLRAGCADASDAALRDAARAAGIDAWIDSLPAGYETMVAGDTCSGGQRQRLAIARALLRGPRLLALDEPVSALDPPTAEAVMATLRELAGGRTVLLVTHRMSDAARADHVVVFEAGRVIEQGPPERLLAADGAWAALHRRETGGS